jgi:hypothetical protein
MRFKDIIKNTENVYRGLNEFKRDCQLRGNLSTNENGDMLADSHNISNRWKNYFSQVFNVHNISDVK